MSTICFNKPIFLISIGSIILLVLFLIFILFNYSSKKISETYVPNFSHCPPCQSMKETIVPKLEVPVPVPEFKNPDIVKQYDYSKLIDPLQQPTRRIPRNEMYPWSLKRIIDIPTRGYPDNFTQYGVLIKQGDPNKNEENKVLRLFARNEYPGSTRYEYYITINSGSDQIKIPVNNKRRQELNDDDTIYIKELDDYYKVSLFKFDQPRYYPDIL
jgi:hypothetical protein